MKFIKTTLLRQSNSKQDFFNRIRKVGLSIYYSDMGKALGVRDGEKGRKYSFKKLGITDRDMEGLQRKLELNRIKARLARLEQIKNQQIERAKNREL